MRTPSGRRLTLVLEGLAGLDAGEHAGQPLPDAVTLPDLAGEILLRLGGRGQIDQQVAAPLGKRFASAEGCPGVVRRRLIWRAEVNLGLLGFYLATKLPTIEWRTRAAPLL
jgi:hypothetical protein